MFQVYRNTHRRIQGRLCTCKAHQWNPNLLIVCDWKPQAMLPASKDTEKTKVSRGKEKATGHCPWPTHWDRACHWASQTLDVHRQHSEVTDHGPAGRVRCCDHPTPNCATDHTRCRWLTTNEQITLLTKTNRPNYPPNQWQLEDTQNDTSKASWHTPPRAWMASVAQWAQSSAPIWCGWQQLRWTHTQGWGMKQLSDDKGELNAEGGKKWPATNQVWLGRCVSPQQTQSPAGGWQRDAEVVKQIAARRAAWAHHEMDRWDWEPLTLTTQRGGSVLENTQISQTHNRKINISVGYDFAC